MRGKATSRLSRPPRPWRWTLGVAFGLALVVALAGIFLSRQTTEIRERPPGNRADDAFREMARRVNELEQLWEKALGDEAERLLTSTFQQAPAGDQVIGITQRSLLNLRTFDPLRQHLRVDGKPPEVMPMYAKFSREQSDDWLFDDKLIYRGSGWIVTPGRPLAWWQGRGHLAVMLLVDPQQAAEVVEADLREQFSPEAFAEDAGGLAWIGPSGTPWLAAGSPATRPDEILRHVSRFGDWSLHRSYPVRQWVTWRTPVLLGSLFLAALLTAGGVAVAGWQRQAMRLAEQRVSFVNRVSHELRTPLTNLLLNTDLALDALPVTDHKLRRRLGLIREETGRLSRIVSNVLAIARIERGGSSPPPAATCRPGLVIASVSENFAPLFERKSITFHCDPPPSCELAIDPDALSQILSNLLSNVEKYAGESAKARLTFPPVSGHFVIELEDDGPGIPREARARVFQAFERAQCRIDEGVTGTGLGLTISRDLAQGLGGTLELLTSPCGARFRLSLPHHGGSGA